MTDPRTTAAARVIEDDKRVRRVAEVRFGSMNVERAKKIAVFMERLVEFLDARDQAARAPLPPGALQRVKNQHQWAMKNYEAKGLTLTIALSDIFEVKVKSV